MRFLTSMKRADGRWMSPSDRALRGALANFEQRGFSSHSTGGVVAVHILNYCVANDIAFELHYLPGAGFYITKKEMKHGEERGPEESEIADPSS